MRLRDLPGLPPDPSGATQRTAWSSVLMFLFMLVLALLPGLWSVAGITQSAVVDLHRDAAFVRALMQGHHGQDPTYLEGALWYPPFITWCEALVAWATGLPVPEAIVKMGPWFNLLAPAAFFVMTWYFLGPVRAVACTAVFLFFTGGQEPGWAVPGYSPRMIPASASQWLFYLELILLHRAIRSQRAGPSLAAGVGAGITFLSHPAPAMLAVLLFAGFRLHALALALRRRDRTAVRKLLWCSMEAGAAFLVATLPLTWYLFSNGAQVQNRDGSLYTYYALTLRGDRIFLYHNLGIFLLFALWGLWQVLRQPMGAGRESEGKRLFIAWFVVSVALFFYTYGVAALNSNFGIRLPTLVPTFHFYFYAKGALTVFAGLAAWALFAWAWRHMEKRGRHVHAGTSGQALVFFVLVALATVLHYPSYATRRDVAVVRQRNLAFQEDKDGLAASVWIGRALPWEAVVLCDEPISIWPMLPTARHVVATTSTMGNPYLDKEARQTANAMLFQAMRQPVAGTEEVLDRYRVSHLLVHPQELEHMPLARRWFPHEVYRNGGYILLARPGH
jgi:hypothetical protein